MGVEQFRFDGKHALVVGGATGMGAAAARLAQELGARVTVMDYAPITLEAAATLRVDLRDRASIDEAIAHVDGPVDAILSCAGIADGVGLSKVNFIGQRHLIEHFVSTDRMPRGSAVAMISSVGGLGWEGQLEALGEYLDTDSYESAAQWIEDHPGTDNYTWNKQAMCAYVARSAYRFMGKGVRINSIMPGPTDTPLARANADVWLGFAQDYRQDVGLEASTPEEQAYPLVFLCSPAARHISGTNTIIDAGYVAAASTDTWDAPFVKQMMGR